MRENYRLMSSLATHTRLNPNSRIEKLMHFNQRLLNTNNIVQELSEWNLQLDNKLLDIPARVLASEQLRFGGDVYITNVKGDWSREMQNKKILVPKQLQDWILIVTERDHEAVKVILYICNIHLHSHYILHVLYCVSVSLYFSR